jgi:hypothetical protein
VIPGTSACLLDIFLDMHFPWQMSQTRWPASANYVATITWVGVERIGLWAISQSVFWGYLALGAICFAICIFFEDVHDALEQRAIHQDRSRQTVNDYHDS